MNGQLCTQIDRAGRAACCPLWKYRVSDGQFNQSKYVGPEGVKHDSLIIYFKVKGRYRLENVGSCGHPAVAYLY
jgi:hypothetical protein